MSEQTFLDTSVLVALFFQEASSTAFFQMIQQRQQDASQPLIISELALVEFVAAATKKIRTQEVTEAVAKQTIRLFERDQPKFAIVSLDSSIVMAAASLLEKYATPPGLRSLDAIQLACALQVRNQVSLFLSADKRLAAIFEAEGLPVQ